MSQCDFCKEFAGQAARYDELYGRITPSRIVARTDRFVALPTLGQLFAGSLLLLPVEHVETCARLPNDARRELSEFASEMTLRARQFGEPVIFEHGATESTGGGCGIYHAHLHIVPLPALTLACELFPEHLVESDDLIGAWDDLGSAREYLLMHAADQTLHSNLDGNTGRYPSQFFRRRIVDHFDLQVPWDWRAYTEVEPALLRTLEASQPAHAR